MRAVSTGELVRLRTAADALLDQTATVTNYTYVSNGAGGYTKTEATTTYLCNVAPTAVWNMPMEMMVAGELANTASWLIRLPYNATVYKDSKIVVAGEEYQPLSIHRNKSWCAALRVACQKVSAT